MSAKHTPGPWHRNIKPASKYNVVFAGRNTHVAAVKTEGLSEAEIEANMDLIAAAPELLDALQAIVAECSPGNRPYSTDSYLPEHLLEQARVAIAKAMGGVA